MLDIKKQLLHVLLEVCLWSSFVLSTASQATQDNENGLVHHLNTVQDSLQVLSRSIRSAQNDIIQRQLEECQIIGPSSNPICSLLLNLERKLSNNNHLSDIMIDSSPAEKRDDKDMDEMERRKRLLEDLYRKEKMLERLKSVTEEANNQMQEERKRSCNLNLGYHCKTEQYSQIADMYNWLQSSLSPGRRKRRSIKRTRMAPNRQWFNDASTLMGHWRLARW